MTLTCLGAARTVTGSKHLLDINGQKVLFDCGLFQGLKELRERNWQPLPVRAADIRAVVLTHAHLDHSGYLPRLVGQGFRGHIFCTPATADLTRIVLADAAKLQEEDAERANRKGYTRHRPALPLFTVQDADRAMTLLQPVGYDRPIPVIPGLTAEFINAGHLLGSAYARVRVEQPAIDHRRQILAALGRQLKASFDWIWRCHHCRLRSSLKEKLIQKKEQGAKPCSKNCVDP